MLRRVALVRTNVSEELSASIIRVTRIGELGTTLAYLATDARYASSQHNIPEGGILQSQPCEKIKSYILELFESGLIL
jgi:hypothetical protein